MGIPLLLSIDWGGPAKMHHDLLLALGLAEDDVAVRLPLQLGDLGLLERAVLLLFLRLDFPVAVVGLLEDLTRSRRRCPASPRGSSSMCTKHTVQVEHTPPQNQRQRACFRRPGQAVQGRQLAERLPLCLQVAHLGRENQPEYTLPVKGAGPSHSP